MLKSITFDVSGIKRWNSFVLSQDSSCLYHDMRWKEVLEKVFGLKAHYLACADNSGVLHGILPLFEMRNILGKTFLVSIPFFTMAGICADGSEARELLAAEASDLVRHLSAEYVELRHLESNSLANLSSRDVFTTSITRMESGENNIWDQLLSSSARRNIRKAQRSELSVALSPQECDNFYRVYTRNMRDLGTPPMPKYFFKTILDVFKDDATCLSIKQKQTPIAGTLLLKHKDTLYDPFVAALKSYNEYRPTNLLYWEAIRHGCRNKLSTFDLGRSTVGTGLFQFKSQWGATHVPLRYDYIFHKTQKAPVCDARNNRYAFAIALWKRLPLWATNSLGTRLVSHLPEL